MGYLRRIVSDARPRPSTPALPIAAAAAPAAPVFTPLSAAAAPDAVDGSEPPLAGAARASQPGQRRRRRPAPDETVTLTPYSQSSTSVGLEATPAPGIDPATPAGDIPAAVRRSAPPRPPAEQPPGSAAPTLRMPRADNSESSPPGGPLPENAEPPQRTPPPPRLEQAGPRFESQARIAARATTPPTRAGLDPTPLSPPVRAPREAAPPGPRAPAESFPPQPEQFADVPEQAPPLAPQPRLAAPDLAGPPLAPSTREAAPTQVRIGHVDVFVRDPAPRRSAPPPRPTAATSASRHHLRRL